MNVYNAEGDFVGTVDDNGAIYDKHGRRLGFINSDGIIFNKYNSVAGSVVNYGEFAIINYTHDTLGKVDRHGTIYKARNPYDRSAEGKPLRKLGYVDKCYNLYLAGAAAFLLVESHVFNPDLPNPRIDYY